MNSPKTVSSEPVNDQYEQGNPLPTASYHNLRQNSQHSSKRLLQEIFEKRPNSPKKLGLVKIDDSVSHLAIGIWPGGKDPVSLSTLFTEYAMNAALTWSTLECSTVSSQHHVTLLIWNAPDTSPHVYNRSL
jgi:hypothetical protein